MHFLADVDMAVPRVTRGSRVVKDKSPGEVIKGYVKNLKDVYHMTCISNGELEFPSLINRQWLA